MHTNVQIAVATNNFEMARQTIAKKRKINEAVILLQRNNVGVHETHEVEERLSDIAQAHLSLALTTLAMADGFGSTKAKIEYLAKTLGLQPFYF